VSLSSAAAATPDQIAADQATIDADQAQLSEAQTSLDEGQIVSPIAGTVASVSLGAAQNVSANSTSSDIVVIGPQSFEVSTTVPVTDVSQVQLDQKAEVVLDGQGGSFQGVVTQIGPPPISSSSSTAYPLFISLPAGVQGLYDGSAASVSVVTGQASNVLTVPTSAVHQLGRFAYVSELRNGKLQSESVTLGAIGDDLTQISSGLRVGTAVILANLSEPLPSSNTTGRAGFAGVSSLTGTGGFPGGGFVRRSTAGGG